MKTPWYIVSRNPVAASAPPAVGVGLTPDSPVHLRTTATNGQIAMAFLKPRFRGNGTVISGDPITNTYLYRFATETAAKLGSAGSPAQTVDSGTASTGTFTSVAAGTYWVCAECVNAGGTSYPSHSIQVVVT